jgi:hypothetical protein
MLDANDDQCTHIVVDDATVTSLPANIPKDIPVVKSEWFWASIQMDACAEERLHVFSDHLGSILSPYNTNTPNKRTAIKHKVKSKVTVLSQPAAFTVAYV